MKSNEYKKNGTPYKKCFITPELRPDIAGQYVDEKNSDKQQFHKLFCLAFLIPAVIYVSSYSFIEPYIITIYFCSTIALVTMYYLSVNKNPIKTIFDTTKVLSLSSLLLIVLMVLPYHGLNFNQSYLPSNLLKLLILAPILEEIIFRGIPFLIFKSRKSLFAGLLISNLYFALIHFPINAFDPLKFSQHFVFGILLSIVFSYYKKIKYLIMIHALCNLVGLFLI